MTLPTEILAVLLGSVLAAIGWILIMVHKMSDRLIRLETRFESLLEPTHQPKHPHMKKSISCMLLLSLIASFAAVCFFGSGCVTSNPNRVPTVNADGTTNFPPAFVSNDGAISNAVWRAHNLINATAPLNPYAAPSNLAVDVIAGAFVLGSGLFAKIKSSQAAKSDASAKTMAQGVVAAGAQQKVLDVASSTPHFADVANHLNEATP